LETKNKAFTIVLLVIVAVLALSLLILAIVFFTGNGNNTANNNTSSKEQVITVPSDDELSSKLLYGEESALLNLKNENKKSSTPPVIKINIELLYYKKVKGVNTEEKLEMYDKRIKELVSTYFQNMTIEEAMDPETKQKAKNDLINGINEMLLENTGINKPIIYNVVFSEWFYT